MPARAGRGRPASRRRPRRGPRGGSVDRGRHVDPIVVALAPVEIGERAGVDRRQHAVDDVVRVLDDVEEGDVDVGVELSPASR